MEEKTQHGFVVVTAGGVKDSHSNLNLGHPGPQASAKKSDAGAGFLRPLGLTVGDYAHTSSREYPISKTRRSPHTHMPFLT